MGLILFLIVYATFLGFHRRAYDSNSTQILKYDSISSYDTQFLTTYCTYLITWFKEWLCTKNKKGNVYLISQ